MAAVSCLRPCPSLLKALSVSWMLFAAVWIAGQSKGQTIRPSDQPTYTLRGTVINSVTGEPIRRARVSAGTYAQLTDSQGQFEFSGLLAGQIYIGVQKPGFSNEETRDGTSTMVDLGPKTPELVVKLIPEGIIFGHLTNEAGEPMEGVFMQARAWRVFNGRRRLRQMGGQSTDEDGYFRIFGLLPGTYYLQAGEVQDHGPRRMSLSARHSGYPSSYFPGVRRFSAATPIQVAAGQKVQTDFSLHRISVFQVSGRAALYPGAHVNRFQIIDSADRNSELPVDMDFATATFIAPVVPAGSYTIMATGSDESGHPLFGKKAVTVSSNLIDVVVSMAPSASIPVVVQTEFSGSSLVGNQPPVQVQLSSTDDDEQNYFSQGPQPGQENVEPGVVLSFVPPGRYYVDVQPQGGWYVESAASGSVDLFSEPLAIGSGNPVAPIRITLRDDGASLAGVVRSDGNPASASVLLVMQDEPLRMPQLLVSDRLGAFQIDNLPPGDYIVLAFNNMEALEYANRDALRDYFSEAIRVTLGSRDAKTVNVDVIHR